MIRMFVRHKVEDFGKWRKAYDDFDEERQGMGVTNHSVYQAADNAEDVTVTHDFKDLDTATSFANSERLRTVMAGAGVASAPEIWFTEQAI